MNLEAKAEAEVRAQARAHFESAAVESEARNVKVSALVESPFNPRKKVGSVEKLAASMKGVGLIQPITVRAVPGHRWEIIAGHRRAKAAEQLGWDTITALVVEATDVQVLELALVENLERESLTPLEEAEGFARLRELAGYTPEQLATKTGRTRGWVYQRLKLLELAPEAKKALTSGALPLSVAIPLARLPTPKLQVKALDRVAGETPMGAREAIEYLQREFCIALRGAPFDRKDDMLVEGAPACTKCPKRSGSGAPGLFEDLDSQDVCTDVVCYQAKARATWEAAAEKYAKQGAQVLGVAEGKRLFRDGVLQYGTGYVEADGPVGADEQRRTWLEVLGKHAPASVWAPDGELRPHRLFAEAEAQAAAAKLGAKWARPAPVASTPTAGAAVEASPSDDALRKVRAAVAQEVLVGSALKMLSLAEPPPVFFFLLARAVESTRPPSDAVRAYLERHRVTDVVDWIAKAEPKALLGFVFVSLTQEWCGGTWQGFDEGLEVMAKAFGFNLSAMVQDATAQQSQ